MKIYQNAIASHLHFSYENTHHGAAPLLKTNLYTFFVDYFLLSRDHPCEMIRNDRVMAALPFIALRNNVAWDRTISLFDISFFFPTNRKGPSRVAIKRHKSTTSVSQMWKIICDSSARWPRRAGLNSYVLRSAFVSN